MFAAADKELSSVMCIDVLETSNSQIQEQEQIIYQKLKQDWACYGALRNTRNYLLEITFFIIYTNTLISVSELRKNIG